MSRVIKAGQVATEFLPEVESDHPVANAHAMTGAPASGVSGTPLARDAEVRSLIVGEATHEARRLLLQSQGIVERRLARLAEKEASVEQELHDAREAARQAGYEEGYRAGVEDGRREAIEQWRQLIEAAQATLEEARREQWRLCQQAEEDLVKLAVALAEKMIRRELQMDESVVVSLLQGMLARVEGSLTAKVRLPTDVYARIEKETDLLPAGHPVALEFHPDEGLQKGDVVIDTDWGVIDGRIQSRWSRIMQGLDLVELGADDT